MERQLRGLHHDRGERASGKCQVTLADGQRYEWLQRRLARRRRHGLLLPFLWDAHGHSDAVIPDAYSYSDIHADANCDCYGHADVHAYSYANTQRDTNGYAHSYCETDAHCSASRNTEATSNASAATDVRGDRKSEVGG